MICQFCHRDSVAFSGLTVLAVCSWAMPASAAALSDWTYNPQSQRLTFSLPQPGLPASVTGVLSQSATDLQVTPADLQSTPAVPLDPLTESAPVTRVTVPPLEASPVAPERNETIDAIAPTPITAEPEPGPSTTAPSTSEPLDPAINPLVTPPTPSLTSRWPDPIPFGQPLPR